ncbi:hypothetical protein Pint_31745 [Pistacia integerrima]|uniref:Uncharacterized protein n=1 Tax=Pistacia integerrima TaxID=434235 RepID=A0ACC0XNG6_9ROSI|nr:hypothetical protein Pint_31745 [Pistacia integerrima]
MDVKSFDKLCHLLKSIGELALTRNTTIEEMVASFLHITAHHVKNRVLKRQTKRSGETVSRNFHRVLQAVLRLHRILLQKPDPVLENSTDDRWKWFKNCLGALDGTYIRVHVDLVDKPRYRTRKNEIATNMLGVCTPDMQFMVGFYYLCDVGYTNGEWFLTPYRGQQYHLNEWRQGHQPVTSQEYFNMKYSQTRNCIERCFGILNKR